MKRSLAERRSIDIDGPFGLSRDLNQARDLVNEPFNVHSWISSLDRAAGAYLLGAGADERTIEIATLVVAQLTPERIAEYDRSSPPAQLADADTYQTQAHAHLAYALARWLLTAERDVERLSLASTLYSRYFEVDFGAKKNWPIKSVDLAVMFHTVADHREEILALFARPQLAARNPPDARRARTPLDIGHAWAAGQDDGLAPSARRVHRNSVRKYATVPNWESIALATLATAHVCNELPTDRAGVRTLFERTAQLLD